MDNVRWSKIKRIRREIAEGTYMVQSRIDATIDALAKAVREDDLKGIPLHLGADWAGRHTPSQFIREFDVAYKKPGWYLTGTRTVLVFQASDRVLWVHVWETASTGPSKDWPGNRLHHLMLLPTQYDARDF